MSCKASIANVFITFLKLGLTSFGGPIAHIGYFRKELVEKQQWTNEHQFSQLLAICQFLPGPASSQLGFALGLIRAGWLGALAAFAAFTLPSALLLIGFASMLPLLSNAVGIAIIHGLKLVAVAVVADAVLSMAKKLCPDITRRVIALLAASALLLMQFAWAQVLIIAIGAMAGMLLCRETESMNSVMPSVSKWQQRIAVLLLGLFTTLLLAALLLNEQSGLIAVSQAFYRAGALVFGGGHVVLPLLEEAVVNTGWVSNESFLAGYGASQAIPGPMFAFSAYLGAIIPNSNGISWASALVALVFMFLPGFLLIAAALPLWQSIANKPLATKAISGVNAVVVGILTAALIDPIVISSITSIADLIIAGIALLLLVKWRLSPLFVVVWCVLASMATRFI
jgi:chromate transporter